jgi:hypothetical protein
MKILAAIGWPLAAVALWVEVYLLALQVATDSCSIGYCPIGHHSLGAAPHGEAAIVATLAVVVLGAMLLLDRRLGRVDDGVPAARGTNRSVRTAVIVVVGIVVWFVVLSFLTWGQPFAWIAEPPPCVAPEGMNLTCDSETSAQLFHAYGPWALLIATGAGAIAVAAMLGSLRIAARMRGSTA